MSSPNGGDALSHILVHPVGDAHENESKLGPVEGPDILPKSVHLLYNMYQDLVSIHICI